MFKVTLIAATALGLLAGCAYHGDHRGSVDNPFVRRTAWFSYLDGGDIRDTCVPGSPDRFRLVYNGQYNSQIRSYEITSDGTSNGGAYFIARAMGAPNLLNWTTRDLLSPWRWQRSEMTLKPEEFNQFRDLLAASGWGRGAPQGKRLHSQDFYWVAAGCRDGQFHFDAWVHAQGDFAEIKFQDFLLARDKTGMAFRQPRRVLPIDRMRQGRAGDDTSPMFSLTVSGEGIGGLANAF
jgi:hypothetical protein